MLLFKKRILYMRKYDMSSNQEAPAKWKCINPKCGIGIPYNPSYDMSNVLCSTCAAQDNAKRLLNNYKWSHRV